MLTVKRAMTACAVLFAFASPAFAVTTAFTFTSTGPLTSYGGVSNGQNYVTQQQSLLNVGSSLIPAYDIRVGDVLRGTVSLAQSITVLPTTSFSAVNFNLGGLFTGGVFGIQTVSFSNHGSGVATPGFASESTVQNFDQAVVVSVASVSPGFTFDSLSFDFAVTSLVDESNAPVAVITSLAGSSVLYVTSQVSAVPEPASWLLLLAGSAMLSRRKSARLRSTPPA